MIDFNATDEEVAAEIARLPVRRREAVAEVGAELEEAAFQIAGVEAFDTLHQARSLAEAVARGGRAAPTWEQAQKEMKALLEPDLGDDAGRRAELVLRTTVNRARAVVQYRELMADRAVFPWWKYVTHGDGRVRKGHAALNGRIFPAGHPIWQRIFPPWEWGCRCKVIPLMDDDAAPVMEREKELALEDRTVWDAKTASAIEKGMRLPNGVPLVESKTQYASPARTGMRIWAPEDLKTRYASLGDGKTQAEFDDFLKERERRLLPRKGRETAQAVETAREKLKRSDGRTAARKVTLKEPPEKGRATMDNVRPSTDKATSQRLAGVAGKMGRYLPEKLLKKLKPVTAVFDPALKIAGTFDERTGLMRLHPALLNDPDELEATVGHEMMHWVWGELPEASRERIREHLRKRTDGMGETVINGVVYKRDKFVNLLAGRADGTEILPYYFELLAKSDGELASELKDPYTRETLELILEVLR